MNNKRGALAILIVACLAVSAVTMLSSEQYVAADAIETPYDGVVVDIGSNHLVLHPADKTLGYSDTNIWRLQGSVFIERGDYAFTIIGTLLRYGSENLDDGYHLILDTTGSTIEVTDVIGATSWEKENNLLILSFATTIPDDLYIKAGVATIPFDASALKTIDTIYTMTEANYSTGGIVSPASGHIGSRHFLSDALPDDPYCLIIPLELDLGTGGTTVSLKGFSYASSQMDLKDLRYLITLGDDFSLCGNRTTQKGTPFLNSPNLYGITFVGQQSSDIIMINHHTLTGCQNLETLTISGMMTPLGAKLGLMFENIGIRKLIFDGDIQITANGQGHIEKILNEDPTLNQNNYCPLTLFDKSNIEEIIVIGEGTTLGKRLFMEHDGTDDFDILGIPQPFKLIIAGKNISIGDEAFRNSIIESVEGWENISHIGVSAFQNTKLESVFISDAVGMNVETAFEGCTDITSFEIDENNPYYSLADDVIYNKDKTTVLGTLSTIGDNIVLPDSVEKIGANALSNRNITQITLNEGLKTIEEGAFNGCSSLSEISIPSTVIFIGKNTFAGCAETGTITYYCDVETLTLGENHIPEGWEEVWKSTASGNRIYYSDTNLVKAIHEKDGVLTEVVSGSIFMEGTVTFSVSSMNYEVMNWIVTVGDDVSIEYGSTLVLTPQSEDATVTVNLRYYSQSNVTSPFIDAKTPISVSDWVNQWNFRSDKTASGSGMGSWVITSTPLIVDNYVYTYVNNMLYKNDALTGEIVKAVQYQSEELTSAPFYSYLGYGGGYIIHYKDGKVYDLNLNPVASFDSDIIASFYNDGYVYGLFAGDVLKKFSIEENGGNVTINYVTDGGWNSGVSVENWHNLYGTTSAPVFSDNYLYYIEATATLQGKPDAATICSIKLSDGSKKTETGLELDGRYMDDGWLTLDGNKLYITTYNSGLFDDSSPNTANSSITRFSLSGDGDITKDFDAFLDYRGVTSQFVIHNGRGYVNVGDGTTAGYLYVFDMNSFSANSKAVYVAKSEYTHGSIVLGRGYTEENGTAYIYIVPYSLSGGGKIVMFEDKPGQTSAKRTDLPLQSGNYSSQAVRAGLNGQLMFYNDPGVVGTYGFVEDNVYYFFVKDGDSAQWYAASGKTPAEALATLGEDVVTLGSAKDITSINGKTGDWKLFVRTYGSGEYSWTQLDNFGVSTDYNTKHYWYITDGTSVDSSDWKYMDQGVEKTYAFTDDVGDKSMVGVPLFKTTINATVAFDNDTEEISAGSTLQLMPNVSPEGISLGWSSSDETVATVDENGRVRGISAGSAVITVFAGSASADCTVTVTEVTIPAESVSLDETSLIMQPGEEKTLTAEVSPVGAPNGIDWTSSDVHVVTVDQNGKIAAVGNGTAKIRATSSADPSIYAECEVTVKILVTGIVIRGLETDASGQYVLDLLSGGTQTLTAEVLPGNATDKDIVWSSSDVTVATVDENGTISVLGNGTATIKVASVDNPSIYAECIVTVISEPVTDVSLDKSSLSIQEGSSDTLTATVTPSDADNSALRWYTSDDNIVTVDQNGKVTAVGVGNAIVTVKSVSDPSKYATCSIAVKGTPVVLVDPETLTLYAEDTYQLELAVYNAESSVTWESSDTSVATVDSYGVVTAVSPGTAVITAKLSSDPSVKDTCTVTVKDDGSGTVVPDSVTLNKNTVSIETGDTVTLTATVLPGGAVQTVTWSSDDSSVASVSNGVVTAVAAGTATITVQTSNGVSAQCVVTVTVKDDGSGTEPDEDGGNTMTIVGISAVAIVLVTIVAILIARGRGLV